MKTSLEEQFKKAVKDAFQLTQKPSNEVLLSLYAHFKQAQKGDVQGKKPGLLDIKGRKKYEAWESLQGMSMEDAKKKYIALVSVLQNS